MLTIRVSSEQVLQVSLLVVVVWAGCSRPDEKRIKCTVEEFKETVFTEWGNDESGKRWEHRFDGVKVKLERADSVDTAWLVQPWFPSPTHPRMEFPEVGETFYLRSLPENNKVLPYIHEQSYWYYEVDRSE
jgi:hypothetical protein